MNKNATGQYVFYDRTVLPQRDYYYRLRQVETDGSVTFSNVIHVYTTPQLWQIYPNPSTGWVQIANQKYSAEVKVFNAMGQLLQQLTISPHTTQYLSLNSGTYFLQIQTKRDVRVEKVVVR